MSKLNEKSVTKRESHVSKEFDSVDTTSGSHDYAPNSGRIPDVNQTRGGNTQLSSITFKELAANK